MTVPTSLFSWPLLIVSCGLIGLGLVTWVGLFRPMVLRAWPSPTLHLSPLYLGAAGLLTSLAPLAPPALGMVVLVLALPLFALGVVAVVWLPGPLQPRWLREAPPWKDPYAHS
jgi:hypothetical protein